MPTIPELFESMPWGPAPEAPGQAHAWLESHGRRIGHVIGGEFTSAGETFETVNPATGQSLAQVTQGTAADVDAAVAAARAAQPGWWALGHAAHDVVYRVPVIPSRPVKVMASGFTECGGGMAANAAVAIARLGGQATYWGRVADDALAARILADLAAEGVDVADARRVPGCRSPFRRSLSTSGATG